MPRHLATTVFEALDRKRNPKFNAHVVAVMRDARTRDQLVERLNSSTAYDRLVDSAVDGKIVYAEPITNWQTLSGYLLKEATPRRRTRGIRCQAPAVSGSSVCRMHGAGGGAPKGNRNALKHGLYIAEAIEMRRMVAALTRQARELVALA
jgi:hypothetical protein